MKKYTFKFYAALLLLAALFQSCQESVSKNSKAVSIIYGDMFAHKAYPRIAEKFSVEYHNNYKIVEVKNAWDTTEVAYKYVLVQRGTHAPDSIKDGVIIEVPVRTMACVFSTHIGYASKLGILDAVKGVSEVTYIKNEKVRQGVKDGRITEIGPSHSLDVEKLIEVNPDILIVSPFKDNKYGKAEEVGMNIAVSASYMENTPLGRAEWIKFISYFFNKEDVANAVFDSLTIRYNKMALLCKKCIKRPTIFAEKKMGDIWYVPGGDSYMGCFYKDAGADYLWGDVKESGSIPLDFETVYNKAEKADYWCMKENFDGDYSYSHIKDEYENYAEFEAFKNKNVIMCNTHTTTYYEDGIMEPDVILADIIKVLHPELLPDHNPVYFQLIK